MSRNPGGLRHFVRPTQQVLPPDEDDSWLFENIKIAQGLDRSRSERPLVPTRYGCIPVPKFVLALRDQPQLITAQRQLPRKISNPELPENEQTFGACQTDFHVHDHDPPSHWLGAAANATTADGPVDHPHSNSPTEQPASRTLRATSDPSRGTMADSLIPPEANRSSSSDSWASAAGNTSGADATEANISTLATTALLPRPCHPAHTPQPRPAPQPLGPLVPGNVLRPGLDAVLVPLSQLPACARAVTVASWPVPLQLELDGTLRPRMPIGKVHGCGGDGAARPGAPDARTPVPEGARHPQQARIPTTAGAVASRPLAVQGGAAGGGCRGGRGGRGRGRSLEVYLRGRYVFVTRLYGEKGAARNADDGAAAAAGTTAVAAAGATAQGTRGGPWVLVRGLAPICNRYAGCVALGWTLCNLDILVLRLASPAAWGSGAMTTNQEVASEVTAAGRESHAARKEGNTGGVVAVLAQTTAQTTAFKGDSALHATRSECYDNDGVGCATRGLFEGAIRDGIVPPAGGLPGLMHGTQGYPDGAMLQQQQQPQVPMAARATAVEVIDASRSVALATSCLGKPEAMSGLDSSRASADVEAEAFAAAKQRVQQLRERRGPALKFAYNTLGPRDAVVHVRPRSRSLGCGSFAAARAVPAGPLPKASELVSAVAPSLQFWVAEAVDAQPIRRSLPLLHSAGLGEALVRAVAQQEVQQVKQQRKRGQPFGQHQQNWQKELPYRQLGMHLQQEQWQPEREEHEEHLQCQCQGEQQLQRRVAVKQAAFVEMTSTAHVYQETVELALSEVGSALPPQSLHRQPMAMGGAVVATLQVVAAAPQQQRDAAVVQQPLRTSSQQNQVSSSLAAQGPQSASATCEQQQHARLKRHKICWM